MPKRSLPKTSIRKVIMPVAGFGTRFLPATKAQPKEMLPIVDKPVIQYLVEEAVASGIKDIIFITGRGKRAIEDHFDESFELESLLKEKNKKDLLKKISSIHRLARFTYVRQPKPLGNGDAILRAQHLVDGEPVGIVFGDDLTVSKKPLLLSLIETFEKFKTPVVALEKVPLRETSKYGIVKAVKVDKRIFKIKEIVEKPKKNPPSNLALIGKYIITPLVFKYIQKQATQLRKEKDKKEIGLTEALSIYLKDGHPVYGYLFEGERFDCGSKIGFLKATVSFALKNKETRNEFKKFLKKIF